jgi:hypothetical protein
MRGGYSNWIIRFFAKYYMADQIKDDEMGGTCSIHGAVGESERKRPLGRSRRKWEDNIKMTTVLKK